MILVQKKQGQAIRLQEKAVAEVVAVTNKITVSVAIILG